MTTTELHHWITLEEILTATHGTLIAHHGSQFRSVGTDTRKNLGDQLFVALKGDAFDAHDYLDQATAAGATGLLIHRWDKKYDELKTKLTIILVEDTLIALQRLGLYRRRQWQKPIIAITGSNGKTTSKEFTAQMLSVYRRIHYNQGSFNNHWGVPLTLLGLQPEHELAICEMGMNHPGEITSLIGMAEPNIVGVTMVGRAHLEGLGSIEAVAQAKEEIYASSNPQLQTGIFNLDNDYIQKMHDRFQRTSHQMVTVSALHPKADVYLQVTAMDLEELQLIGSIRGVTGQVRVPVFGLQNLTNLLFAAGAALAAGLTPEQIWMALPQCRTTWGRNQRLLHGSGSEFLFDGYNANPDSQKALIENLKMLRLNRPLVGIFGEMRELGSHSASLHEELGALVSSVKFDEVIFVGNFGEHFKRGFANAGVPLRIYPEVNAGLMEHLQILLPLKPLITIKGSRGVRLERILLELNIIKQPK